MKKSLIALAVLAAASGAAMAQSSVTLFGVVDATIRYNDADAGSGGRRPLDQGPPQTAPPPARGHSHGENLGFVQEGPHQDQSDEDAILIRDQGPDAGRGHQALEVRRAPGPVEGLGMKGGQARRRFRTDRRQFRHGAARRSAMVRASGARR